MLDRLVVAIFSNLPKIEWGYRLTRDWRHSTAGVKLYSHTSHSWVLL